MSVTFAATHDPARTLNLANLNAIDLLRWLGLRVDSEAELIGEVAAPELAARCRRRLWDEPRNHDPELPGSLIAEAGRPTVVICGRRAGYLREKTAELLTLVEACGAGDMVRWG